MRKWAGTILALLLMTGLRAQDPYFTQNVYHALYLNPAYTGYGSKLNAVLSYRNQWRNDELPSYRTTYVSADAKAFCYRGGAYLALGTYLLSDQEFGGVIKNTMISMTAASGIRLNRSGTFDARLLVGLSAGVRHRGYDISDPLLFESVIGTGTSSDPLFGGDLPDIGSHWVEDIGAGMALEMKFGARQALLIGASGTHLTSPELTPGDRLKRKFSGNMLWSMQIRPRQSIRVFADASFQGASIRSHTGVMAGWTAVTDNASVKDDVGLSGGVTFSVAGDDDRALTLESISPVIRFGYRLVDVILTKDFNLSTRRISHQKGGLQCILRIRIGEHRIRSREVLPKLCSEPCPLP